MMLIKFIKNNFQLGIVVALTLLIVLVAAPLSKILMKSIYIDGKLDLLAPFKVIVDGNLITPLLNTLLLGACVVIGATVIALPVAYITAKTEIGKHKWIDMVLLIPFMTPPYIGSMGWILFMQPMGFLNQLFPKTKGHEELFFSFFGLVMIMSLHLFPFMYLMLKNSLERVSGSLDEAAIVHGSGFFYRITRVTLPLLFSAYILGSLLIFVKTIGEFGTPITFGRQIGFQVLTTEIHRFVSKWPLNFSKATSLSYFLLFACIVIWYIQSVLSKKYTYTTIGGKGLSQIKKKLSHGKKAMGYAYIGSIVFIAIGIPYFSILMTSFVKLRGYGLQWSNFTFQHYIDIFKVGSKGLDAFLNSLKIATCSATLCAVIGIFLSIVIVYNKGFLRKIVDLFSLLPNTVPAIVLVIGLILFWNTKNNIISVYNTFWMVIITYVAFYIPYSVQYIKSSLSQISETLLNAGRIHGGSYFYNIKRILLPLIIPGILAGWTMTFTIAFRELVAAMMILPPGMETSSTYIFGQFEQGEASLGMAMAVISVAITLTILMMLNRFVEKRIKSGG